MQIIVNGEDLTVSEGIKLIDLLLKKDLNPEKVVVELNLNVIPFSEFEVVMLKDGDKVEILNFVGGG